MLLYEPTYTNAHKPTSLKGTWFSEASSLVGISTFSPSVYPTTPGVPATRDG